MTAKTLRIIWYSLPTCNHIIIENNSISPCNLVYMLNKIIPYHTTEL